MTTALIVDDDAFMRTLTATLLNQLGIAEQFAAADGEEALACLAANDVDVMLCDLNMPGMDGISLLRHVAKVDSPPAIVLFSGEDGRVLRTAETLASAHKLDVLGTVAKPPTPEALEPLLMAFMERSTVVQRPPGPAQEMLTPEEIAEGLERGLLALAFQPQVDAKSGQVLGVESLARWEHPTRGLIGPWAFIGVAERHGLIGEITRQVLELSLGQVSKWLAAGHDFTISVNVTVDDLADVDFADGVLGSLDRHGVRPERLLLEVTESKIMRDVVAPLEVLTRLRMRRVGLALDDYGTGASSMEQLARIPFTELKVDRQFVATALEDPRARAMLESAVGLARNLDLESLAEGVETQEQWDLVVELGCDRLQGYFIAPPLTAPRFEEWLVTWDAKRNSRA